MDERKRNLLESDNETAYYDESDIKEVKAEVSRSARDEQRRDIIRRLNGVEKLTQADIGEVFDISASRVSQIVNSD